MLIFAEFLKNIIDYCIRISLGCAQVLKEKKGFYLMTKLMILENVGILFTIMREHEHNSMKS